MALSIILSLDAIRRRDFVAHGQWMVRAYAIGMGAGTQAVTHLPYFAFVVVTEWLILRRGFARASLTRGMEA